MRALLFLSACLTTLALEPGPQDLDQAAGPAPGDEAPDFTLKLRDGKTKVTLSSFEGQKPVVLIFGSYSWDLLRSQGAALEALHRKYRDRAAFYIVYIREAHPKGMPVREANARDGICVPEPTTEAERRALAKKFAEKMKVTIPVLVDTMDDATGEAWGAWPDRGYIVGLDGRIAGKSPRGFNFNVAVFEQYLRAHLEGPKDPGVEPMRATLP